MNLGQLLGGALLFGLLMMGFAIHHHDNENIRQAYKDGYVQGVSDETKELAQAQKDVVYGCINTNGFFIGEMEFYCQPIIPLKSR